MTTSTMKSLDKSPTKSLDQEARFTPNMHNYRTSLAYEGLALKKNTELKSIADLKRLYSQ